jgi:hypothetical protein
MPNCYFCNKHVQNGGHYTTIEGYAKCNGCNTIYCYDCYDRSGIRTNHYCSYYGKNKYGGNKELNYCSRCTRPQILTSSLNYCEGSKCSTCGKSDLFDSNKIHHKSCLFFRCHLCDEEICHDCNKINSNNEIFTKYNLDEFLNKITCSKCIQKDPLTLFYIIDKKCTKCKNSIKNDLNLPYDDFIHISKCNICPNIYCWDCGETQLHVKKINNTHLSVCPQH